MAEASLTVPSLAPPAPQLHTDVTARWFLVSAISYFFIVGIVALTIAAKFCWPSIIPLMFPAPSAW